MNRMDPSKKLKRGLKDLSPLFSPQSEEQGNDQSKFPRLECLSVFSPDYPGDSFFLNSYLASQIASCECPCDIISVQHSKDEQTRLRPPFYCENLSEHMTRTHLNWEEFDEICARPLEANHSPQDPHRMLFLDLDYGNISRMEKIIPILDKWVLLLQPNTESLAEAYRLIKGTRALNQSLEYYLILEGQSRDETKSFIFEQFSSLLARRLGINLVWLGYLHSSRASRSFSAELELEHLFFKNLGLTDAPEKISLAQLVLNEKRSTSGAA